MDDLELLKLAAKAAGYAINFEDPINGFYPHGYLETGDVDCWWNPLNDDGDALRLASDLRLIVKPGKHIGDGCTVESQRPGVAGCTAFYDDKRRQMRFSIVRVGAEIGLSIK